MKKQAMCQGKVVSVDQMISPTPGLVAQMILVDQLAKDISALLYTSTTIQVGHMFTYRRHRQLRKQ